MLIACLRWEMYRSIKYNILQMEIWLSLFSKSDLHYLRNLICIIFEIWYSLSSKSDLSWNKVDSDYKRILSFDIFQVEIGFVKVKTSSKWFVWTKVQIHKFYKRIFSLDISKTILRRGWQANIIQQSNTSKLSIITHTKVKTDKFGCESSICAFEGGPYAIKLSPFEDPSKRNLINDQAWAFKELHNRVM